MTHLVETGKLTLGEDPAKGCRQRQAAMITALLNHLWQSTLFASGVGLLGSQERGTLLAVVCGFRQDSGPNFLFVTLGTHWVPQSVIVRMVAPTLTSAAAWIAAPFSDATLRRYVTGTRTDIA